MLKSTRTEHAGAHERRDPRGAAALLAVLALLGALALRSAPPVPSEQAQNGPGDVAIYQATIARLRTGTPYYDAVGGELRHAGYATREVFNWRTPLLMTALAAVPDRVSRVVLVILGIILCGATMACASAEPFGAASAGMQFGVLALILGSDLFVMGELWAGVLIGLSVCAARFGRRSLALVAGLLALFVRELAAPYCIVCTVLAFRKRRWREFTAWLAGAFLYAIYYGRHLVQVQAHHLPADLAHPTSWLALGGLPSVISKLHWNGWLLLAPRPLTVLAFLIVVAGISQSRVPLVVRATGAAYLAFFVVAGKPFDEYWGLIAWPACSLAIGGGIETISDAAAVLLAPERRAAPHEPASLPPRYS